MRPTMIAVVVTLDELAMMPLAPMVSVPMPLLPCPALKVLTVGAAAAVVVEDQAGEACCR